MNISIQNVSKIYKLNKQNEVTALKDISMEIRQGDYCAICGVSGSGKSTLLHMFGLLDKPSSGRILFDNDDPGIWSESKRAKFRNENIGYVLQDYALIPYRTVEENLEIPLYFSNTSRKEFSVRVKKALEATGVDDLVKRRVNSLSGGQMQRVAIARALINEPKLILADEPTGALDSDNKEAVIKLFKGINDTGISIVVVTHDADVAASAGKCFQIKDGRFSYES